MNSDGLAADQPTTTTICARCEEKIVNVMTADEQKVYHPHCFLCSDCGKTLAGGFFYKSKVDSARSNAQTESRRYCETCYQKIAPKWFVTNE